MPSVSIIVPCYNVAPYLKRCMDSLIGQTLRDIEIICIDDKSTDDTLKILREYAAIDKRIRVIVARKNGGVAAARNAGLKEATGEYIGFVDPDDYVDLDFYEKLYNCAKQNNADIARAELQVIWPDGTQTRSLPNATIKSKYDFYMTFTTAIYRADMIRRHDIQFPVSVPLGEDIIFLTKVVSLSDRFVTISGTNYLYIRRDNSLDSTENVLYPSDSAKKCLTGYINLIKWAADQNLPWDENGFVAAQAYNLCIWLLGKQLLYDVQKMVCAALIDIYNTSQNRDVIRRISSRKIISAIRRGDINQINWLLSSHRTRIVLFGILPLLKIENSSNKYISVQLFEYIPIMRSINEKHRYKLYVFGLLVLKIKH